MIKRCKAAFAASVGGVPRVMRPGTLVQDDDPVIKGREHLFEDVDAFVQQRTRVEAATDEPGGRRSLTRPTKKTAAKSASTKPAKTEQGPATSEGTGA